MIMTTTTTTMSRSFKKAFLVLAVALLLSAQTASAQANVINSSAPSNVTGTGAPTTGESPPPVANQVTAAPTMGDTGAATTTAPTGNPTVAATTAVPQLTATPTLSPTFAPSIAPAVVTGAPVETGAPTAPAPITEAPSMSSEVPTTAPTGATMSPTMNATSMPSMAPSGVASMAPSVGTTSMPSTVPSMMPSQGEPTTFSPTELNATGVPTSSPTVVTGTPVEGTVENLVMTLVGMNQQMSPDAISDWEKVTAQHTVEYYEGNPNLDITEVVTTVTLIEQGIVSVRRLRSNRQLQTASVKLKYNQKMFYLTPDPTTFPVDVVALAPFDLPADREAYTEELKAVNTEFEDIQGVQDVEEGDGSGTTPPVEKPEDGGGGGLGTGAIIGIVVGCVGGVALVGGAGYYVSQRGDDGGYVTQSGKTPPSQLDMGPGYDEVSTLAEPNTIRNENTRNSSIRQSGLTNNMSGEPGEGGYGDQSVATVDYDYSKAYGGGGENSVSSAGGTFGSQTHTNAAGGAAFGASATNTPLDGSFESGSQFRGQNSSVREELIDIYAPPGKLGVVIDTPDDGAPVVHAVKDSSVIADKLEVGDKLVAVDDEDVRSMTAIKVSKLISRKSANASRKLSIIRTAVVDE